MQLKRAVLRHGVVTGFLSIVSALTAGTIPITIVGVTQTQIIIQYAAPSEAPCTVSAIDNGNGPPVNDLDAAKFPNASTDLGRTVANGFRWPTLIDGLNRTVYIGGHDEIKLAADGKWYSTALQVNTDHTITVSCNAGSDVGTAHASTDNIHFASAYPELMIPQPGTPMGNWPNFTVDWSRAGRNTVYTDAMTGLLLKRVSGSDDSLSDANPIQPAYSQIYNPAGIVDVSGAWTNPSNIAADPVDTDRCGGGVTCSTATASTSTQNAVLFVPFAATLYPPDNWTDFLVHLYGYGSSSGLRITLCPSTDSGQTCATYNSVDIALQSTKSPGALANWAPCNASAQCVPSGNWAAWGGMKVAFGSYDLRNLTFGGVNVSGSSVSIAAPSFPYGQFNLYRVPGSKFLLSGTGCPGIRTVAQVVDPSHITTVESSPAASGCTYSDLSVGMRLVSKDAGTVNVSIGYTYGMSSRRAGGLSANGDHYMCALQKVNVASAVDCDGNANVPVSGLLCGLPLGGVGGVYFFQDPSPKAPLGRTCLQSVGYFGAGQSSHFSTANGVPFTSADTYWESTGGPNPILYKCVHNANNYAEMPVDPAHANNNDRFSCVQTPLNSAKINSDITAQGGAVATIVAKNVMPPWSFHGVIEGPKSLLQFVSATTSNDGSCMIAEYDPDTLALITSFSLFNQNPYMYGTCHFGPSGAYPWTSVNATGEMGWRGPNSFTSSLLFGGPFLSRGVIPGVWNGSRYTYNTFTVTNATQNASPVILTISDINLDDPTSRYPKSGGAEVNCSGATGDWAVLNAELFLRKTGTGTYAAYSDSTGASPVASPNTPFTGQSLTCTTMRALYSVQLINYSAPTHQFSIVFNSETASRYPDNSITNVVQNGDPVSVTLTSLNGTTQYWLKKVDGSHVQVYQDQGLTSLVPDTTASGWNGWFATYAMTCPAQNSVSLPQPMYADTTAWVNGAPKVRCVQIQANDACSDFPASGEAAAYPCARPGTAGSKSMLHEWTTSDGIGDLAFTGTNGPDGEGMYVLTSSCSNGLCTITAVRDYEDDATVANYGFTHSISASYHANQHAPGWTMRAESAVEFGWVNGSVFPPTYYSPPNLSGHMDLVAGVTPGNITTGVGPGPNQRDSCTNCTLQELSSDVKSTTNSLPVWQAPGYTFGGPMSYPSTRVWPPVAPATEVIAKDGVNVQRWRTDWLQWNTSIGGFSVLGTTALTLQTGTSHVYKVTPANAPLNVKIAPIYASDGVGRVYKDISSAATGNVITDATADSFCLALVAGQCRSGSSAGDIYLSTVGINYDGNCRVNNNNLPTPCVMGLPPWVNRAIQESQYPVDTNASRYRLLVMGFQQPLTGYAYSNWVPTPDGRWGIWAQNPPARHTFPGNGESDYWAMKLPPWPDEDHVNRSRYVPVEWRLSGSPGDRIRIAFGYAENGDPAKLYCTSRQETCWTSSAATDTNPFVFDSEAQQKTACDQGCVVNIPAIPGRVLFFQIERSNGSNAQLGPLQTRAVR